MKPKDLPTFYSWEDRIPRMSHGVLCVPRYFSRHEEYGIKPYAFNNDYPIHIEFCSGNGEWIANMAEVNKSANWIGVERKFKRIRKIWAKKENRNLENLLPVCGNAEDYSDYYLKPASISEIYINFPDPWPKKRHAKHRLLKEPFITSLARITKPHASLYVVTDDIDYSEEIIALLEKSPFWVSQYKAPYFSNDLEGYGSSYFNRLWLSLGRKIRFIHYKRSDDK